MVFLARRQLALLDNIKILQMDINAHLVLQQIIVVHAVNKTMLLHARLVYCQVLHHKMGDAPLQQSPVKEANILI